MFFVDQNFCCLVEYLLPKALNLDGSWIVEVRGIFPSLLLLHKEEPHFACVLAKDILEGCPG